MATEVERVVREIIQILHDSQKGFAEIGHRMKNERLKSLFLEESQIRANFRGELENELHRMGVHDVKESGTAAGTIHRVWGELKMKLGGNDHTLLETAEQGEDEVKKVYTDALEQELPMPIKEILVTQQEHIMESHDIVRTFRDSTKAA
ncbi:MAG: PA2169 family four-helix-bundle protein [Acidobacteriaceae bacterium]